MRNLIFAIVLILGAVFVSGCVSSTNSARLVDVCNYLPTQNDLTSEWEAGDPCQPSAYITVPPNNANRRTGYTISKIEGLPVEMSIYRFPTPENAISEMDSAVNPLKQKIQEGTLSPSELSEIPTTEISANCYAIYRKFSTESELTQYVCTKGNIYFQVGARISTARVMDTQEEAKYITNIIATKIE
jgi:hypothetical protein